MIWPFIFLSYASLFVFGLSDNVRGPLFPEIMSHFQVSDSRGALIYALSNISGFIASHGCRYLLRRYDRLSVLRGGSLGLMVSMLGMGTAPYFWVFLVFSFCFGLSLGVLGLIPNILVPLGSSPTYRQRLLSGLHTMYGLASLLSPLLAALMEHLTGSWRWTFIAGASGPLLLLLYTFHSSHKSLHTKAVTLSKEEHHAQKAKNFKPQLYLALMLSFAVAAEIMVSSRLALYMRRIWEYDMESSSLYVTYFFVSMMLGRGLFAAVHFRKSPKFLISSSLVATGVTILLGLYWHPIFLALTGFSIAPCYPLAISWISEEFPEDLDAVVSYMMATDSIMLILMHVFIGKLTDLMGIHQAILIGMFFVLASFIMVNGYTAIFKRGATQAG